MESKELKIVFHGLVDDDASTLQRIKGVLIADFELGIPEVQKALTELPATVFSGSDEVEAQRLLDILLAAGGAARIEGSVAQAASPTTVESTTEAAPKKKSVDNSLEFEFEDSSADNILDVEQGEPEPVEVSFEFESTASRKAPALPDNAPGETKAEVPDEPLFSFAGEDPPAPGSGKPVDKLESISSEIGNEEPLFDFAELGAAIKAAAKTEEETENQELSTESSSKLKLSSTDDDLALVLGEEPALAAPIAEIMVEEDDDLTLGPDPVLIKNEGPSTSPVLPKKAAASSNSASAKISSADADNTKVAANNAAKPLPVMRQEEPLKDYQADQSPDLENHEDGDSEESSSLVREIGLPVAIGGVVLLAGTLLVMKYLMPSDQTTDSVIPQEILEEILQEEMAQQKKKPAPTKEKTFVLKGSSTAGNVSVKSEFTASKSRIIRGSVDLSTPEPPDLTPEEIVLGVQRDPHISKALIERIDFIEAADGSFKGEGTAKVYIEGNRLVVDAAAHCTYDAELRQVDGLLVISHNFDELPKEEPGFSSTRLEQDAYSFLIVGKLKAVAVKDSDKETAK